MSPKKKIREDFIKNILAERGSVSVGSLAETLDVSMQTIRRDLEKLSETENWHRAYGRISVAKSLLNTPFELRASTNLKGKQAIAEITAQQIPDGSTIFISIGSTPLEVSKALLIKRDLTVITNNLGAALTLGNEKSNRILIPGGEIRLPDKDIIGDEAVQFFDRFRAEFAIFGVGGVANDGGLLDFHPAEVQARIKMKENSTKSILVLDNSKFSRHAPATGDNIANIDLIICDNPGSSATGEIISNIKDKFIFAEKENELV